jgi:hypothetical protein
MNKILIILFSILTLSCTNDKTALNLVTGINFRETGDPNEIPLQLGNPNVFVSNMLVVYPNPSIDFVYISANQNISSIWIVAASPEKIYQDVNFSSILSTDLYSEQTIVSNSKVSITGKSATTIVVNIGILAKGYYKVFVKINGEIYWDNLYKLDSQGDNQVQFNALSNFWK